MTQGNVTHTFSLLKISINSEKHDFDRNNEISGGGGI